MKSIDDYFSSVIKFLAKQKVITKIEPQNPYKRISEAEGRVEARVYFFDQSYLDVGEMVRIEEGIPRNFHYRYHYQKTSGPIFTYDDAPHHPELETFPYHKHFLHQETKRTESCQKVTLTQVIKEIVTLLS